jgi:hypothetical protein
MCADPMGMRWMLDIMARKPKPTNTEPGLIYMLNGALQHSYTDPFDRTSPAIPIGPHWMIIWPFDARIAGLPTVMRDAGTLVMFAGTPYAHLHRATAAQRPTGWRIKDDVNASAGGARSAHRPETNGRAPGLSQLP